MFCLIELETILLLPTLISSRKDSFQRECVRVCVCVDEYKWAGLLMAAVGAVTSPFTLSVVTDLVPWLQIVSRARAHPEDRTAALCFSPANDETGTWLWSARLIMSSIYVFMVHLYY